MAIIPTVRCRDLTGSRGFYTKVLDFTVESGDGEFAVHRRPVDQTWGTREFYVDDPADNTLRFTQRHP
jgi:catechol 2,3-dioxygenase-like lactoylglutathione lyase family enzyme